MRGFFLACAFSLVAAQNSSIFSFTGSFSSNGPQISPNMFDNDDGSCDTDAGSDYYYTTFNYTFATAGVRALFTFNIDYVSIVPAGQVVNWTDLCNNSTGVVFPLTPAYDSQRAGTNQFGHWFSAATYTFIVMGDSSGDFGADSSGNFGGEIWEGNYNGQTTAPSQIYNRTWLPITGTADSCDQDDNLYLYDTQVVFINTSGYYNLYLTFAQNTQLPWDYQFPVNYPGFSIIQGNMTDVSAATCASLGVQFIGGFTGSTLSTQAFNVWLTGNQTYTVVVQGGYIEDSSYYGHYALTITPARYYPFTNRSLFATPDKSYCSSSDIADCVASEDNLPYAYTTFSVPMNTNFFIAATQIFGNDLEFYIYSQSSLPITACGTAGLTCFAAIDSLDSGTVKNSGIFSSFTIVATAYSSSNSFGATAAFDLYILSGPTLGAPAPTPATPTTATPSNTMTPTNAMTPTAPTASKAPTAPTASQAPTAPTASKAPTAPTASKAPTAPTTMMQVASGPMFQPCLAAMLLVGFLA